MNGPPVLRGMRAAFVFLTRIPVGGFPYQREDWRWSTGWFPFVGAVLGGMLALTWSALRTGLDPVSTSLIVVAFSLLLTGAFHEDGLADTADAMGGAYDRSKLMEILKDSRVGAFGAAALVIGLSLRVSLLAHLDAQAPVALVLSQAFARLPPIALMVALPYVTADAASKSRQVTRAGLPQLVLAFLVCAGTAWGVHAFEPLAAARVAWIAGLLVVAAVILGARFMARAGGLTGDFLGATEQVGEVVCLAALAWGIAR